MQKVKLLFIAQVFLYSLMLSQCSLIDSLTNNLQEVPKEQQPKSWAANKKNLNALKNSKSWTLLARVGIVSQQGSTSSQADWVNTQRGYSITLNNLLTFGEIVITKSDKNKNNITLEYQGKTYKAQSPDQLLFELTKLNLPVSQLEYWILGLPSPQYVISHQQLNKYAVLDQLAQDKFNISYSEYSPVGAYLLPSKIIIKSPGLHIKIQVQSWYV